ncbi:AMP-binding protein [Microbacterium thalassium]|uniref:Propionyl-CoA synthetase n=1 Tax=Microbacterium thalassium TaxID=362649 RepID=A0A7X0FMM8_9MICO|nr:AMP-binding protein [Microbacterium thalassium]MBB6389782.1 propionyl-CoA synthetase [Microbacterium thalassium]GLK24470.1 propionyl-CoA synthetase [Microbacterium thalassium]
MADEYATQWRRSMDDPEGFWLDAASAVTWTVPPSRAHDGDAEGRWFPDAALNMSDNALDRHVDAGRGENIALRYHSAMTGTHKAYTYRELRDRVAEVAGMLQSLGVGRGDRVLIYLPMTPEAVMAMLACARLGAIHSVVFGGFAASELAVRIADARPSVIVTASGGLEPGRAVEYLPIVRKALEAAPGIVGTVVVRDRAAVPGSAADMQDTVDGVDWLDWDDRVAQAQPAAPVPVVAHDPLYILYTSGTTGSPKGVVRDTGGYAVALAWAMRNIYDIGPGDTMFTASDVGWVVGHSFIVYGPLIAGGTTVLFEGKPVGTPDAGEFWRVVRDHGVKTMFTAPTALRAIRRVDPDLEELPEGALDGLETLFLAGERLDPETWHWANDGLGVPIVDHWWQTETGWPICAVPVGLERLETRAGSTALPMPGYDVRILDGSGRDITGTGPDGSSPEGNIALRLPLPPGTLTGIWGDAQRYRDGYLSAFPGFYATGDAGHIDPDGYVFVMGRTDDVINVAGHRLSTGSLEEVLTMHHAVAECAVIGIRDHLKGQRAAGFVTLKAHEHVDHDQLEAELVALVREHIGPVAAFRDVTILERLPKTRSGKILRKTMRQIVDGEPYRIPATIEDPAVLDALVETIGRAPQTVG